MDLHTLQQNPEDQGRARQLSLNPAAPPLEIPGYDMHARLGEGAYGEVWHATERNTSCPVAIKFYTRRRDMDWSHLAREVEKLAFLANDRHVVQLKGVGWDSEPPWYAMEYLERGSLEDLIKDGPLDTEAAVTLFRDIAVGLVHSHGKGVLHCDLKPANVLLDQDDKPRLCDFGQARLSNELTPALGTLFYMAPEQADLKAAPDVRWDVYALGALLHCMLTGQPPYRDENVTEKMQEVETLDKRLAVYRQHLHSAPKPVTHRSVPGVDKRLAEIVDRCLAVNPSRRYPNVQSVLSDLDGRSRWRAQRPMIFLATVGPLLMLLVVALSNGFNFRTAIEEQKAALLNKSLDGNGFAASFVSRTVGDEVARRWEALEQSAADVECRRALLDYRRAVAAGDNAAREAAESALAAWIRRSRSRYENMSRAEMENDATKSTSWFITDQTGTQLARHPLGSSIGQNYAHRDYFHGQGLDLPPGTSNLHPIRRPHLSIMFMSTATHAPMVAFSVPIFAGELEADEDRNGTLAPSADPTQPNDDEPIGVLAMTVELGSFTELQRRQSQLIALIDTKPDAKVDACAAASTWKGASAAQIQQELVEPVAAALRRFPGLSIETAIVGDQANVIATIEWDRVDYQQQSRREFRQETWDEVARIIHGVPVPEGAAPWQITGRRGALLEHPAISDLKSYTQNGERSLFYYLNSVQTDELLELCSAGELHPSPLDLREYRDPVGDRKASDYEGNYLAAVMPVVADYQGDLYRTGWAVVVQEREQDIIRPVASLGQQLLMQTLWGLGLFVVVLGLLWLFVLAMLRGIPRLRWLQRFRRHAGMTVDSSSGVTRGSQRSPRTARTSNTASSEGSSRPRS